MVSFNDSRSALFSSDLQYVSVEDMYRLQCFSSYALCWWWFSRECGIFAQMYEKIIQEHNVFYVQYVIKNGNETGSDLALIVGVLLYAIFTDFKMALFFKKMEA